MEEMMVTIPLSTYTELTVFASDAALLKRILREKKKTFSDLEYKDICDLCVMFGIADDGGAE